MNALLSKNEQIRRYLLFKLIDVLQNGDDKTSEAYSYVFVLSPWWYLGRVSVY